RAGGGRRTAPGHRLVRPLDALGRLCTIRRACGRPALRGSLLRRRAGPALRLRLRPTEFPWIGRWTLRRRARPGTGWRSLAWVRLLRGSWM
ncbi:hypothetical protein, partial [Nocardia altamirensis]|uniref:hypothetical protein n=1 Tax=Nocardia altamirensis TaxID=472158 RepID=UPI001C3FE771